VLAEISGRLAEWGVSIESMIQRGRAPGEAVSIVMVTHNTTEGAVTKALKVISGSSRVIAAPCVIPMEAK
jgi:homoserine dehydrogenase